ncbi:protein enabled homolog [Schistocerca americana]|uniref:protein enabled homolog n=1 Tax=Schistocerca americana TaxID=7009 RepID=UPI001F4FF425|nr:protein enabled homolog [Schistocerca americana]
MVKTRKDRELGMNDTTEIDDEFVSPIHKVETEQSNVGEVLPAASSQQLEQQTGVSSADDSNKTTSVADTADVLPRSATTNDFLAVVLANIELREREREKREKEERLEREKLETKERLEIQKALIAQVKSICDVERAENEKSTINQVKTTVTAERIERGEREKAERLERERKGVERDERLAGRLNHILDERGKVIVSHLKGEIDGLWEEVPGLVGQSKDIPTKVQKLDEKISELDRSCKQSKFASGGEEWTGADREAKAGERRKSIVQGAGVPGDGATDRQASKGTPPGARRFPLSQLVTARPERATSAAGRHNLSQKLLPAAAPTKSRMDGAPLTPGGSADRAARRKVSHCPPPLPSPPPPSPPSSARQEPFVRPGWKYPHCREPSR